MFFLLCWSSKAAATGEEEEQEEQGEEDEEEKVEKEDTDTASSVVADDDEGEEEETEIALVGWDLLRWCRWNWPTELFASRFSCIFRTRFNRRSVASSLLLSDETLPQVSWYLLLLSLSLLATELDLTRIFRPTAAKLPSAPFKLTKQLPSLAQEEIGASPFKG